MLTLARLRRAGSNAEPAVRARPRLEAATEQEGALTHADDAVSACAHLDDAGDRREGGAVPLKAAVMNLLSIGGAYGIVVAVFQWGWLKDVFHLEGTYLMASPLPTIFFAVLFGLSMDYEVFLLSRIREEYDATGDNAESVARGMAATGRVITSAALIMTVVFLSFVANPSPLVKMMGLGLSTAIVLDATIVRMVVVPATMALMGRANWWLPGWLDRLLPQVGMERDDVRDEPEPVLVGASVGG